MPQGSISLGALRSVLDEGSAAGSWSINPDGVLGRALMMAADAPVSFPVRLTHEMRFSARVMLLPHDWRDGRGAVRASVAITDGDGVARELWSGTLRSGRSVRASPRGLTVAAAVPAGASSLTLTIHGGPPGYRAVARAIWLEPALAEPATITPPASALTHAAASHAAASGGVAEGPLISVLTPVHDPPLEMLREAIDSVRAQTFDGWELCLVDDGSRDPDVIAELQRSAASDQRIQLVRREAPGGISDATNAALETATGRYIALLDHDDTLAPDALAHVAARIAAEPDLDMLYSDEDIISDGRQVWVHLKPAWSPDTLRTNGYTCHLGVYRRELVQQIGGFRPAFDGSQDVDMILRFTERTDRIAHIPRILYHWRAHSSSTAGGDSKPYAYVAARNAIAAHLKRTGLRAEVGFGPPGLYRVAHHVDPALSVDLVLALHTLDGLPDAAASWQNQPHPSWHAIIAAPTHLHPQITSTCTHAGIPTHQVTLLPTEPGTDPTTALATAADTATAEHLLLMQTPAQGLTHDWLTRLLGYSHQPGIAAAGPVLLSPDGRIQNAGIALPDGIPLHLLHGTRSSMDLFFGYGTSVYNVSAVSGVVATARATYRALGGLRPGLRELSLIDYCLRAPDRIVIVPDTRLRATGPDPAINDLEAMRELRATWTATHGHDPYYNPNYRTDRGDFERRPVTA